MKLPTDFRVKKTEPKKKKSKVVLVSEAEKVVSSSNTEYFDKTGNSTSNARYVCSKTTNASKTQTIYHVLIQHGILYDNKNSLPRRREYKTCTEKCFNYYTKYLKSGIYGDYEKAVRAYISTQ